MVVHPEGTPVVGSLGVRLEGTQVAGSQGACRVGIGSLVGDRGGIAVVRCLAGALWEGSREVRVVSVMAGRRGAVAVEAVAWRRIGSSARAGWGRCLLGCRLGMAGEGRLQMD